MSRRKANNPGRIEFAARTKAAGQFLVFSREGRFVVACALLLTALIVGPYLIWQRIKTHVLAGDDYQVSIADVHINPLPSWDSSRSETGGDSRR